MDNYTDIASFVSKLDFILSKGKSQQLFLNISARVTFEFTCCYGTKLKGISVYL